MRRAAKEMNEANKHMQEKNYRRRSGPPVFLSPISAKAEEYDCYSSMTSEKVSEGHFNQNEKLLLGDVKLSNKTKRCTKPNRYNSTIAE